MVGDGGQVMGGWRGYLVSCLTVRTPPLSPVVDGDDLIVRQGVARRDLEDPPQLLPREDGVSLKRRSVTQILG